MYISVQHKSFVLVSFMCVTSVAGLFFSLNGDVRVSWVIKIIFKYTIQREYNQVQLANFQTHLQSGENREIILYCSMLIT